MERRPPCDQWVVRLSAYVDREDPNPEEVVRHLAECEACQAWVEAVRADRELMLDAFSPPPDVAFTESVMAGVREVERAQERAKSRVGRWTAMHRWAEIGAAAAVVALLVGLTAPIVGEARAQARARQCLSNVHEVATATLVYATDYANTLPPAEGWDMRLTAGWRGTSTGYVRGIGAFQCPDSMCLPSYFFPASLGGERLASYTEPWETVLLFEEDERTAGQFDPRHHGEGSIGFLNGSARMFPELPPETNAFTLPVGG